MDVAASPRGHWQGIYATREPEGLSWFEAAPTHSLEMIAAAGVPLSAPIVDVGGGASRLAGALLDAGYTDITVADLSPAALELARAELGARAQRVAWVEADVRRHDFGRRFAVWHDRAVLHFMVEDADRDAYVECMRRYLAPGGQLVIASFSPRGPTSCSGLPVHRYSAAELLELAGEGFELVSEREHEHITPSGARQRFTYAHLRRAGGGAQ